MIGKLDPSAACQYGGKCYLPHTGLQLEHIVGLAVLAVLVGVTLVVVAYRLLHD